MTRAVINISVEIEDGTLTGIEEFVKQDIAVPSSIRRGVTGTGIDVSLSDEARRELNDPDRFVTGLEWFWESQDKVRIHRR